jgi:hypothetical protein
MGGQLARPGRNRRMAGGGFGTSISYIASGANAKGAAKPTMIWSDLRSPLKNYAGFLDALRNRKLDDRINYPP